MNAIREAGTPVQEISLAPLARADVQQLVATGFVVNTCTGFPGAADSPQDAGNPFFLIQFLNALADEGLLTFDHDQTAWSWMWIAFAPGATAITSWT